MATLKFVLQKTVVSRKAFVLWFMFLVATSLLLVFSQLDRKTVDYSHLTKPSFTMLDEMRSRRSSGLLDNIQLKDLIRYTKVLKSPASPCKVPPKAVVLVQSACPNKEHRMAIRDTWGYEATGLEIPLLFFLGHCPSSKQESAQYGDLVEVDFVDSYFNNTLKTLARLRWYLEECANAEFLLMADDDIVLHVELLMDFLHTGIGYSIFGTLYPKSVVRRDRTSKWYVPVWAYPGDFFPPYIGGGAYVVNGSTVRALYEASHEARFITVDDALLTGIVAGMIGLYRVTDPYRFPVLKDVAIRCGSSSVFSVRDLTPAEVRDYWAKRTSTCEVKFST